MCQSNIQERKENICRRNTVEQLNDNKIIQDLEPGATYTFFGMEEGDATDHLKIKVNIQKRVQEKK